MFNGLYVLPLCVLIVCRRSLDLILGAPHLLVEIDRNTVNVCLRCLQIDHQPLRRLFLILGGPCFHRVTGPSCLIVPVHYKPADIPRQRRFHAGHFHLPVGCHIPGRKYIRLPGGSRRDRKACHCKHQSSKEPDTSSFHLFSPLSLFCAQYCCKLTYTLSF